MSFSKVNWRRGLSRLWIIISIFWIICFGLFTLPTSFYNYIETFELEKMLPKIEREYEEEVSKKRIEKPVLPRYLEKNRELVENPFAEPKKFDPSDYILIPDQVKAIIKKNRAHFYSSLILTLSPPLVLLVIGLSLFWIIRGFKLE